LHGPALLTVLNVGPRLGNKTASCNLCERLLFVFCIIPTAFTFCKFLFIIFSSFVNSYILIEMLLISLFNRQYRRLRMSMFFPLFEFNFVRVKHAVTWHYSSSFIDRLLPYLATLLNCIRYVASNGSMTVNNELDGCGRKRLWPIFKFPGGTEVNHEYPHSGKLVSRMKIRTRDLPHCDAIFSLWFLMSLYKGTKYLECGY